MRDCRAAVLIVGALRQHRARPASTHGSGSDSNSSSKAEEYALRVASAFSSSATTRCVRVGVGVGVGVGVQAGLLKLGQTCGHAKVRTYEGAYVRHATSVTPTYARARAHALMHMHAHALMRVYAHARVPGGQNSPATPPVVAEASNRAAIHRESQGLERSSFESIVEQEGLW